MIKPNWSNFQAQFNDNPQKNFEWFCYLLFCQEFKKPSGVFRYRNQAGIETNPVKIDDEVIGWQAKFYGTRLSDHKSEMMEMIRKSKRAYSQLTKIIFYTNQEWGQGRTGNDSEVKKEVDQAATNLGVDIEWRTEAFFESPFVVIENEIIARHFFALDEGIFDLLEEKRLHSENVLREIQTAIDFKDTQIEIDRSELLDELLKNLISKKVLVVSGVGGVGKTAVIKKLHARLSGDMPFYVFKASEFNRDSIDELFNEYSLTTFSDAHLEEEQKVIVVDSAEKLLDLTNTDPFKEFLSVLIKDGWQIIFTTRNNYLTDLNCDFIEVYKVTPGNFDIRNLDNEELAAIAQANDFNLPEDTRLLELIRNPFYLSEYLRFYNEEKLDYVGFKEKLWNRIIVRTSPARERCFLTIAFQRATEGQFFVSPACNEQILAALVRDGVLGYASAGYFITHDIYEEWALEKKIAAAYVRKANNKDFFELIGESLPIRRSLRNWVSEQLLLENATIDQFLREIIQRGDVASFWQDELWTSVLLSDHSDAFFELFKRELIENDQELLKRVTFLLRLACKEVDYRVFKMLGVEDLNILSMKCLMTKPKGEGWRSTIRFIHDDIEQIGLENLSFFLPAIYEWNQKVKKGKTTRLASLIALKYYQSVIKKEVHLSGGDKENLLETILAGSATIKVELKEIFEEVLKNSWNGHRDPYYDLMEELLTKDEAALPAWAVLPEYVLKVADLFWYRPPQEEEHYFNPMDVEDGFCLSRSQHKYHPASPYQTPIYWLLRFEFKKTIDFILAFTNKTSKSFANSRFSENEVQEVNVFVGEDQFVKQYICDRLWCSYRGSQVSTNLLQSMHMALEKYLLEVFKDADPEVMESWLLYLLRKSKSASISAVVASIVQAFPEKTFNVAKVLFKTKEFFLYDMHRWCLDPSHKSSLTSFRHLSVGFNFKNECYDNERIKACDDPHRKTCLEHLAFKYQFIRAEGISEKDCEERQKVLWAILDEYYSQLPDESQETDADKTWRLFLARMDYRKMKPTSEVKDEGVVISFNPEIDPQLKKHSEESLEKVSEHMRYLPLKLWAGYRKDKDERFKQYEQYESNPPHALEEAKEIFERFKQGVDEGFLLFNRAIPSEVGSVLLMEFFDKLSKEDRDYCKDIILEYANFPLSPDYQYQLADGTDSAIAALPVLFRNYPQERDGIKANLLLNLFNDYPIGMGGGSRYSIFPTRAIHQLWEEYCDDMQSLFLGYLLLKPKRNALREKLRQESLKKQLYKIDEERLNRDFFKEYDCDLDKILKNTISADDLDDLEQVDLHVLDTGLKLIPMATEDAVHKKITLSITSIFAARLLPEDRENRVDYSIRHSFIEQFAYVVLKAPEQDVPGYLEPFLNGFNGSEVIADLFKEFITAEDRLNTYDRFWQVWDLFFEKVVSLGKGGDGYGYVNRIIESYLFAGNPWKETAEDWHAFKDNNSRFFENISKDIGHCPATLCAMARSLNGVASRYLNSGIAWLSEMLTCHKGLRTAELETNTLDHIESLVRKYIYNERQNIRRSAQLKEELLVVLEFLVERGSVVGYMLRENIL